MTEHADRLTTIAQWLQRTDDGAQADAELCYDVDGLAAHDAWAWTQFYILEHHTPVAVADVRTWGQWYETSDRLVAETSLAWNIRVSTVFMGLNDQFGSDLPLLFKSTCFWVDGPLDEVCDRCATWAGAEAMHQRMVDEVRDALAQQREGDLP